MLARRGARTRRLVHPRGGEGHQSGGPRRDGGSWGRGRKHDDQSI